MLCIRIDVHHHGLPNSGAEIAAAERRILSAITRLGARTVQELDDLTREVSETTTVVGSAIALIQGLKEKLDAAIADPAKLAALSAELDAAQATLAAAVAANTPAEPDPATPVETGGEPTA